jgi:hypothetical protein
VLHPKVLIKLILCRKFKSADRTRVDQERMYKTHVPMLLHSNTIQERANEENEGQLET